MQARAFEVNEGQLRTLHDWVNSGDARLMQRARVVLLSHEGVTAERVSEQLGVARVTVYKWRKRFRALGLRGLHDLPRSGQPRKLAKSTRDGLVSRTVFEIPPSGVRWSVRQLARDAGITEHQVRRIWADHGLQPHKRYGFPVLGSHGRHLDEVQLCGLFLAPPHNVCVLAVRQGDAKGSLGPSGVGSPRGRRLRRSVRDLRHGEDSIFAALERLGATGGSEQEAEQRLGSVVAGLERIPDPGPSYELHLVCSSEATLQGIQDRLGARAGLFRFTALPLTCAWAESLEQLLSDVSRQGHSGAWTAQIHALRENLSAHSRTENAQSPEAFGWYEPPRPWSQPMARSA